MSWQGAGEVDNKAQKIREMDFSFSPILEILDARGLIVISL